MLPVSTFKTISKKYKISVKALAYRARKLSIKGYFYNNSLKFTKEEVKQLVEFIPMRRVSIYTHHRRNITFIEMFLRGRNGKQIARTTGIQEDYVYPVLKEFVNTGYVTIDSRMNYQDIG